jgi:hypothetical protein
VNEVDKKPTTPRLAAQFEPAAAIAAIVEATPGATPEQARADLARLLALADQYNALSDVLAEASSAPALSELEKVDIQLEALIRFIARTSVGRPRHVHLPLLALGAAVSDLVRGGRPALLFGQPDNTQKGGA